MKLGIMLGYTPGTMNDKLDLVHRAEALGFDSVWTSEAWGRDAVTSAAWVLARTERINVGTAIMQMGARTPAAAAMAAMSMHEMSGGRFIMGIGPSGPQVIEGWHGTPYGKPLGRTREYIAIIRKILAREAPLEHDGEHYQIPYNGPGATGLGKSLKTILHPDPSLKIYTGSFTPAGVRTAAEIADGVIPIFANPERLDLFADDLSTGFGKAAGAKTMSSFDFAPFCRVVVNDDLEAARNSLRDYFALYIGGMGAKGKNFYNDYACTLGFEEAAGNIQDLFLNGKRAEAAAAVPDQLIDELALVGPRSRIKERLDVWKSAARDGKVTTLINVSPTVDSVELLAEAVL
ncbi:MAG: LLM class F420-dependent oxidoreductase [Pseudomonadota bacterium]